MPGVGQSTSLDHSNSQGEPDCCRCERIDRRKKASMVIQPKTNEVAKEYAFDPRGLR